MDHMLIVHERICEAGNVLYSTPYWTAVFNMSEPQTDESHMHKTSSVTLLFFVNVSLLIRIILFLTISFFSNLNLPRSLANWLRVL